MAEGVMQGPFDIGLILNRTRWESGGYLYRRRRSALVWVGRAKGYGQRHGWKI